MKYKVKDDIDLNILKNYGWELKSRVSSPHYALYELSISCTENLFVDSNDRIIQNDYDGCRGCDCDTCMKIIFNNIQNLINDNIVENFKDNDF